MFTNVELTEVAAPWVKRFQQVVPKSPKEMSKLRRRLTAAGYRSLTAAVLYGAAEIILPFVSGGVTLLVFGFSKWYIALFAAAIGYMLPGFWLSRKTTLRQKQIRNGLPDALDLMIVCIEAGSGIDQSIVKTSDELDISYPALAEELRLITTEMRAGKPRLEAFKNFASRTKVDDVRSLVAMLVQTDRFGTSIAHGAAHACGSRHGPNGGRMRRSGPQRSASSSCSRSCSVCFLRSTSPFSDRRWWTTFVSSSRESQTQVSNRSKEKKMILKRSSCMLSLACCSCSTCSAAVAV